MNRFLALKLFVLASCAATAQDAVYLTDPTTVEGTIVEITEAKVAVRVPKGESSVKFSYKPERVLALTNQRGQWLCMAEWLALGPEERTKATDAFLDTTPESIAYDVIVKRTPLQVMPVLISYESDEVINYQTPSGGAASIAKADVAAVFRRQGAPTLTAADVDAVCQNAAAIRQALRTKASNPDLAEAPSRPTTGAVTRPLEPAPASSSPGAALQLTDEEHRMYSDRAVRKVEDFATFLGVIADKSLDAETKNKAIDQACRLFKPGASIQVSSMVRGGQPNTYRIRDYLTRLKLLPYGKVSIEWSNIQFVENLTQLDDGKYRGVIKGEQRFSGFGKNGELKYGDVTEKNVEVLLEAYQKQQEGQATTRWDILLGDVGVVATR